MLSDLIPGYLDRSISSSAMYFNPYILEINRLVIFTGEVQAQSHFQSDILVMIRFRVCVTIKYK